MTALVVSAVLVRRRRARRRWKASAAQATALAIEHRALHRVAEAIARARPRRRHGPGRRDRSRPRARRLRGRAVRRRRAGRTCEVVWSWARSGGHAVPSGRGWTARCCAGCATRAGRCCGARGDPAPAGHPLARRARSTRRPPLGRVVAGGTDPDDVTEAVVPRLERFAELVGIAFETAENRARLRAQATTDPLTGLLNHRAFLERLQRQADHALRARPAALAIALFDLDHFKAINDGAGHHVGDDVLREVARRLTRPPARRRARWPRRRRRDRRAHARHRRRRRAPRGRAPAPRDRRRAARRQAG